MSCSAPFVIVVSLLLAPINAFGGIVTSDEATLCAIKNSDSSSCQKFHEHPWKGKYEATLGLDAAFSFRSAAKERFAISNVDSSGPTFLENQGTSGIRMGITARLEFSELVGAAWTAGFDSSFMSASPDTGMYASGDSEDPFMLSYSGPYVEGAVYYPAQRIDTAGVAIGFRRFFVNQIEFENKLDVGPVGFKSREDPFEAYVKGFLGPFYMGLVARAEKWRQIQSSVDDLDNSGIGIEFGLSGPIVFIFPWS